MERLANAALAYVYELHTLELPGESGPAKSGGVQTPVVIEQEFSAPYNYDHNDTEKVNLSSGGLLYETVDYVLPGVNGLDLIIGRRYNSELANIYNPGGYAEAYCDIIPIFNYYVYTRVDLHIIGAGEELLYRVGPQHTETFGSERLAQNFYNNAPSGYGGIAWYVEEWMGGIYGQWPLYEYYIKGGVDAAVIGFYYDYYVDYYTTATPNNYLNDLYGLGHGWSFMFSSIEIGDDGSSALHLADGRSFGVYLPSVAGNANIYGNNLADLRLERASGAYSNGAVSSLYTLYYKDGRKEYFSSDGKLIGIQDRYGNTIKFVNDKYNTCPRITITDTLNRVTVISCSSYSSSSHTMKVTLPSSLILNYTVTHNSGYPANGARYLTAYADPLNIVTNYAYTLNSGGFDVFNKTTNGNGSATNYFLNLTTITHPTGVQSVFTYGTVIKHLGDDGLQTLYRLTSRKDMVSNVAYNEKTYSYSAANSSGWPTYNLPSSVPSNYTYWTMVTIVATGVIETHTFNKQHLTTNIVTKSGNTKIKEQALVYTNKLPTQVTTKTYDYTNNNLFSESIDLKAYDNKGNIISSWSPLANGDTNNTEYKTTYTYDPTYNQLLSMTYKQDADQPPFFIPVVMLVQPAA